MQKMLIVCGPTGTGKTQLGVKLAKEFNGEIVSADSRQVYRGMDVGTGKDLPVNSKFKVQNAKLQIKSKKLKVGYRKKDGVPVWLVDVVEPDYRFNVGEYRKLAHLVIADIWRRNKLPIVVGGTGLYIRAITQQLSDTTIPPNPQLRRRLDQLRVGELQEELEKIDRQKFSAMNSSDRQNPRRLIRAIEVGIWKQRQLKDQQDSRLRGNDTINCGDDNISRGNDMVDANILWIGLIATKEDLQKRIEQRVHQRIKNGMIEEIKSLLAKGYTWDMPAMSGLGYRQWQEYFLPQNSKLKTQNSKLRTQIVEKWKKDEFQYAKRQLTWFRKEPGITWFDVTEPDYPENTIKKVNRWYNQ